MAINYNYPTNNQSSKSNPFTGYKYPYPTGGATRPPDNRSYQQRAFESERASYAAQGNNGMNQWLRARLFEQKRPLNTIFSSLGLDGAANNGVVGFFDEVNPIAAGIRLANSLAAGDWRDAGNESINLASTILPGGKGWKKGVKEFAGWTGLGFANDIILPNSNKEKDIPFTKEPLLPQSRDMTMTAEEMAKRAAMERNRTDAAGNSGMGGRRIYADPMVNTRAPGGTTPPPLDLAPLTPEQLNETGQDLVELEQVYQDALNQYGLAEKRGQQGYVQDVQGARRKAAGSAQDLANQLASAGLDISPAAAFGAGQMTNAPRMARETSARKTLDQLLAEITTGRTQARTKRDRNKLMTNNQINAYRNQNSFDAQQAAYERMAGN